MEALHLTRDTREVATTELAFQLEHHCDYLQRSLLLIPDVAFQVILTLETQLQTERVYLDRLIASAKIDGEWVPITKANHEAVVCAVERAIAAARDQYAFLTNEDSMFSVDHGLYSMGRQILAEAFSELRFQELFLGKLRSVPNELADEVKSFQAHTKDLLPDPALRQQFYQAVKAGVSTSPKWQRAMRRKKLFADLLTLVEPVSRLQNRYHLAIGEAMQISDQYLAASAEVKKYLTKMWELNRQTAYKFASRYLRGNQDCFDDLCSEVDAGLLKACSKYNPRFGTLFTTFMMTWVRQKVVASIDHSSTILSTPHKTMSVDRKLRRIQRAATAENRSLDILTLSKESGASVEDIVAIQNAKLAPVSTQAPMFSDESGDTVEAYLPSCQPDVTDQLAEADATSVIEKLMLSLSHRERQIISARHGLGGRVQSLGELGENYGLTSERIRQLQLKAERKMLKAATLAGIDADAIF